MEWNQQCNAFAGIKGILSSISVILLMAVNPLKAIISRTLTYAVLPALYHWCFGITSCWWQFLNWAVTSISRIYFSLNFILSLVFVCCCSQICSWENLGTNLVWKEWNEFLLVMSALISPIKFYLLSFFSWKIELQHKVHCDFSWERLMLSWGGVQGLSVEWSCGLCSIALFYLV